jgi:FkbM family methyltransferase
LKNRIIKILKILFKLSISKKAFFIIKILNYKTNIFKNETRTFNFKNRIILNLNLSDWIQFQIYFLNRYEEFELNAADYILMPGDNCIDVGSNFGLYSLWFSNIIGKQGKVISFEPFEENFKNLENNVRLNKSENITLVKKGLTDKVDKIDLYYDSKEQNLGMVTSFIGNNNYDKKVIIETTSLDKYLIENTINAIKFIKIDIEGGELLALNGMVNSIIKFEPIIQVEIDESILNNTPYSKIDVLNFFDEINYEMFEPTQLNKKIKKQPYSKNYFFRSKI